MIKTREISIHKFMHTAHFGTAADMVDVKVETNFTYSWLKLSPKESHLPKTSMLKCTTC